MYIHSNELSTFTFGCPIVLLDKYRNHLLMSVYQLFFVHSVRIRCALEKLPVMILTSLENRIYVLNTT